MAIHELNLVRVIPLSSRKSIRAIEAVVPDTSRTDAPTHTAADGPE
jgi:hypothetical protein